MSAFENKIINTKENLEKEKPEVGKLAEFDREYYHTLGDYRDREWLALDIPEFKNQKYFTVVSTTGEKLGIIGVYDTNFGSDDEINVTHTVVDPKYRGLGLAAKFKQLLMKELNLPFITLTVDLDNESSVKAVQKLPGVERIDDEEYRKRNNKAKFIFKKTE